MQPSDTGWIIGAVVTVSSVFFAACVLIIRSKDMQAWKPAIDAIPLIQKDVADIRSDVAELRGIASVVPAVQASQMHMTADLTDLKQRVRDLERGSPQK